MSDQFDYVKAEENDNFTAKLRPKRINESSLPSLPETFKSADRGARISSVHSVTELTNFTREYSSLIKPGDVAVILNTFNGTSRLFVWVDDNIRWQEIILGSKVTTVTDPALGNTMPDHTHINLELLEQFSLSAEGKLLFNGNPIDGHTHPNIATLNEFSEDDNGNLLFKGALIKGSGGAALRGVVDKFTDLVSLGTPEEGWMAIVRADENNGLTRSAYIFKDGTWVRLNNKSWYSGGVAPSDKSVLWVDISGSAPEMKWWNGLQWESIGGGAAGKTKTIQSFTPNNYYSYGEVIIVGNQLYTSKRSFTSGDILNQNDWELLGGDMRRSIYDKDFDGIVDRAEFADVAQLALETSLVQSWKPNTDYTAGMQLVYLSEIYTVRSDHRSPASFNPGTTLDLTATGYHDKLWGVQGGDTSQNQYYHLPKAKHDIAVRFSEAGGKLQYGSNIVGDMERSVYDKNRNGVVDKAELLEGMTVTVADINKLQGMRSNVQTQIDSLTHGMVFKGFANTFAEIGTVLPNPTAGDTIIVNADETQGGVKTFYTHSGTTWIYLGPFTTSTRDFTIAPIDLSSEVAGMLPEALIDPSIARKTDFHSHTNLALLETYTQTDVDIVDAVDKKHAHLNKPILDSYTNTNLDITDAVNKKHNHTNIAVLDYFSTDSSGRLIWKGAPIASGTGGGGGISDLSLFTTNDLRDSLNKRYVTDQDKSNLALIPGFATDISSVNTAMTTIKGSIPSDASSTNKLVTTSALNTKIGSLKVTQLLDVDPIMKANAFVVVNGAGDKLIYKDSIADMIKIPKVIDKSGSAFTNLPALKFNSFTASLAANGTLELSAPSMFSTDLTDMPKAFENGKVLVSNLNTMKYELKDIGDLTNSKANFTKTIDTFGWSSDSLGMNMAIVNHGLNSLSLVVAFYDAADNFKPLDYKILNANEILIKNRTAEIIKVVINCSQGTTGNGLGGSGGGSTGVTTSDFIDDLRVRTDKTYSSSMIASQLSDYAKRSTIYTRSEADARFSLKGTEHTHTNILTLNKLSEDLNGNLFYGGKKLLTSIQPFFAQQHWNNEIRSDLSVILNVIDIYDAKGYTAIMESEFTVKNMIASVDPTTDAQNMLHLVVSDGTIVVLDVEIEPGSTQKYLLGISPNTKIMIRGTFSANYYISAY